jgi:hypothetical protein
MSIMQAIWKYTNCCRYRDVQWSPSNKGLFAAASYNNLQLFKMKDRYVRSCPSCPGICGDLLLCAHVEKILTWMQGIFACLMSACDAAMSVFQVNFA